ncbi:hypothetical protein [Mesorhizobium sp. IMUNJ 23232]|uniref:hypothetical protein n=1 Tax=Mesorhizobium sp. IMUNJ 23232 TaxID=3376064 RepID=UPI00378E90E1
MKAMFNRHQIEEMVRRGRMVARLPARLRADAVDGHVAAYQAELIDVGISGADLSAALNSIRRTLDAAMREALYSRRKAVTSPALIALARRAGAPK